MKNLWNVSLFTSLHFKSCFNSFCYVPKHHPVTNEDVQKLQKFIDLNDLLFVITGAGISTESGIPDYRSENVGMYARSPNRPIQYKDFMNSEAVRKRYWARNFVGWTRFSSVQPNKTHFLLADWEKKRKINWLITQNVDRLHHKAGSWRLTELHGTSYTVKCTSCNYSISRFIFQEILKSLNNETLDLKTVYVRPDGDVELNKNIIREFYVPNCIRCNGILKPDIIFFGESVPICIVKDSYTKLQESTAVLVLGSSLQVYSAYRFLLAAEEQKKPIGIINIGQTRADRIASLKLHNQCSDILSRIKI